MAGMETDLHEAWWQLGCNQFHDILAGTCVHSTQEQIRDSFGKILTAAEEHIERAAFRIARTVDTRHEPGSVLTVVNPYPKMRLATIELDTFKQPHGREEIVGFEDTDGTQYPVQWTQADANFGPWGLPWAKMTATLPVPACGHQTFKVLMANTGEAFENPFSGEENAATEQFRKTERSASRVIKGEVVPAFATLKTALGTNLLAGSPKFLIIDDPSSTWGHGVKAYNRILAELEFTSVEKIISGEVLSVTRHRAGWDQSEMLLDVREHHVSGLIELHLRFNWQQQRQMLKLAFPTTLENTATVALNTGSIVCRPADGSEYPCHDWVALKGELNGETSWLAVANDSTYAFSSKDGQLAFTLARGVPYAEHPPFEYKDTTDLPFLDQGWQEKRFWLQADSGDWQAHRISGWAQEVQIPVVAILDSGHHGYRPYHGSLLEVDTDAVLVHAFVPGKNGNAHLLRIQENKGTAIKTVIHYKGQVRPIKLSPWQIASVTLPDHR
jgi:alpha-mannosidase